MPVKHGIQLKEKRSVGDWNKSLGTSFADLFKSLGKATAHGFLAKVSYSPQSMTAAFGQLGNVTANLFDAGGTLLNLKKTPHNLAWRLVFQSLARALGNLVEEHQVVITEAQLFSSFRDKEEIDDAKLDALAETLRYSIDAQDLTLLPEHIKWPRRLPILGELSLMLAEWLRGWDLPEAQAVSIANRLPAYFVFALNDELRRGRSEYAALLEVLETPATPAAERESRWQLYSAWLQKEIDRPLFNTEPFSPRMWATSIKPRVERSGTRGETARTRRKPAKAGDSGCQIKGCRPFHGLWFILANTPRSPSHGALCSPPAYAG